MPMGRPRKYHTPEEQREAHRVRNKNYYHRNKEEISIKRQSTWEARRESQPRSNTKERWVQGRKGSPLHLARLLFKRCQEKIKILKGKRTLSTILTEVCVEVRDSAGGDPNKVEEILQSHREVISKSTVEEDLNRCHHEILNLVGCGRELDEVKGAMREVREIQEGLDYIWGEGLVDFEDFLAKFALGQLDFQV